jgi:hypothetical protein
MVTTNHHENTANNTDCDDSPIDESALHVRRSMDGSFSSALTTKDDEDGLSLSGSFGTVEPTYQQRIRRPLFGLVVYHLHKRATEVDCTLAFVREGKEEIEGTDTIGSNEMGMLIRRVAMGLPPVVMERTTDDGEGGGKVWRGSSYTSTSSQCKQRIEIRI